MRVFFRCMVVVAVLSGCSAERGWTPLDGEFLKVERNIRDGVVDGRIRQVVGDGIASLEDAEKRRVCLEKFRKVILSKMEGGENDYPLLVKRIGSRESLSDDYLDVAARVGVSFSERMEFRIAFIEWLSAEHARQTAVGISAEDHALGLHVTAERYLVSLDYAIYERLRRMELAFDESAARECSPEELARLRLRLEDYFGRSLRTTEEVYRHSLEWWRKWKAWRERCQTEASVERPTWRDYFK